MIQKFLLPLIAAVAVGFAIAEVLRSEKPVPPPPPPHVLPESPYPEFVAGAGLVEPNSENIDVASPVAGTVARVFVRTGDSVKAGDPLFEVEGRALRADLAARQAAQAVAEADAASAQYELGIVEQLNSRGTATTDDLEHKRLAVRAADARVRQAEAVVKQAEAGIELLTVRSPIDGQVLKLTLQAGELAPSSSSVPPQPEIVLGSTSPLYVRVEVNETDAWRIPSGGEATAFLRGNPSISVPLTFVRFEPSVAPKQALTGAATERVDTRAVQVLYSFNRDDLPIFIGQELDVFIESKTMDSPASATQP